MKSFILIAAFFFSMSANAAVYSYRLFEDSIHEYTPFVLNIELDDQFAYGAKVTKVTLVERLKTGTTVLFVWNKELLNRVFKFSWKGNALVMDDREKAPEFKSVVKKSVSNPWGDTDINSHDKYSLYLDKPIVLTASGASKGVRFEILNQTVEEACLFGVLTK